MSRRRQVLVEAFSVVLLAALLVGYFTFPLIARPGQLSRIDSGDGQFSIWNVSWVAHAIITPDDRVFDANIFSPERGTLAYSEANLGAGVLAVPAYAWTGNPYIAHNSAYLLSLLMAVVGMYYLARRLTGSRPGAVVAAMVFTFCPFLFAHTAHIQLLMVGPWPFVFLALHTLVDRPTLLRASALGVMLGVQGLFCAYYGVLAGLLAGAGIVFYGVSRGQWRRPGWWGMAVYAAGISGAIVLPFFLPYLALQRDTGFGRALDEARKYSADWRAYLASSAWFHAWMLEYLGRWKEVLFPGFVALAAGATGAISGIRSRGPWRESTVLYLVLGALAAWASLGPAAGLYSWLYHIFPVFSLLRAPARFGIAVAFALSILSAFGVAAAIRRAPPHWRRIVIVGAVVLTTLDLSMTMPFREVSPVSPVYQTLARARPGVVMELPFFYEPHDVFRHSRYMVASTAHWLPLVNGYSDYIPADYIQNARLLASFPNPEGFDLMRARRTRYVVIHKALYAWANRQALERRIAAYEDSLRLIMSDDDIWLYEIVAWPAGQPPLLQ